MECTVHHRDAMQCNRKMHRHDVFEGLCNMVWNALCIIAMQCNRKMHRNDVFEGFEVD